MLSFHTQLKVFVATAPCDLRRNFNGLWPAARARLAGADGITADHFCASPAVTSSR